MPLSFALLAWDEFFKHMMKSTEACESYHKMAFAHNTNGALKESNGKSLN